MLKPPVKPMLLQSEEKPFDSTQHLFEYKWDGFRSIIFINNQGVYLQSRQGKDLSAHFPELQQVAGYLDSQNLILDGEICYFSPRGKIKFNILQKRLSSGKDLTEKFPVTLIIWDLLAVDNRDIYRLPLTERKHRLQQIVTRETQYLQISPYILYRGKDLYKKAREMKLEGIVAKKLDSVYEFKRSNNWQKIKIWQYTEAVIGGYPENKQSLLVGKFKGKQLDYRGRVKLALPESEKTALFRFLPSIEISNHPFHQKRPEEKNITWVKPVIKCLVKYTELTEKNSFRHGQALKLKF